MRLQLRSLATGAAVGAGAALLGSAWLGSRRSAIAPAEAPHEHPHMHGSHRHSSFDERPSADDARLSHDEALDAVDRASADSFPASDPPPY